MPYTCSLPRIVSKMLFIIIYTIFLVVKKIQVMFGLIERLIFARQRNPATKIQECLLQLDKKPEKVCLSVRIDEELLAKNGNGNVITAFKEIVGIVRQAGPREISIFVSGQGSQALSRQINHEVLKEADLHSETSLGRSQSAARTSHTAQITLIDCDMLYRDLKSMRISKQAGCVPLLIAFNCYQGLNSVPFPYLIDAELTFCPPVTECAPLDIFKCFQQYATSEQRHGK